MGRFGPRVETSICKMNMIWASTVGMVNTVNNTVLYSCKIAMRVEP